MTKFPILGQAPSINGYQTLKEIRIINPEQKTVITSGELNHPDRIKTEELGVSKYLAKPVALSLLAKSNHRVRFENNQICGITGEALQILRCNTRPK